MATNNNWQEDTKPVWTEPAQNYYRPPNLAQSTYTPGTYTPTEITDTPAYDIDYNDPKFQQVAEDKKTALDDNDALYDGMVSGADEFYDKQIQAAEDWKNTQSNLLDEQTDFAIEKIEQQKGQAKSDYLKEQSGSYADWQKQSAQHGVNAEQRAASGMQGTGYSESSQVSMYNTYQNRMAMARESFSRAKLNYDNAIHEAMLQNSSEKAKIAYEALQAQLELALEGFQYKNTLLLDKANKKLEIENMYYNRWQDVLTQMNTEIDRAENIRQFNANFNEQVKQFNATFTQQQAEFAEKIRQFDNEMARLLASDEADAKAKAEAIQVEKDKAEADHKMWVEEMQHKKDVLKNQQDEFNITHSSYFATGGPSSKNRTGSSSGKKTAPKTGGSVRITQNKSYEVDTPYYQGSLNKDAKKYGTFSNGYQPKGISGHGKLKNSGDTLTFKTQTRDGHKMTVTQTIWKAADGTRWYWEGRQNKYIKVGSGAGGGGRRF